MEAEYLARRSSRYVRVTPGALYESAVQSLVEQNIHSLFPGYRGGRMEPKFTTPLGGVKPDLVLVRGDLSGWAVVEVEIETHPDSHILPQALRLTGASADDRLASVLKQKYFAETPTEAVAEALSRAPRVTLVIQGSSRGLGPVLAVHSVDVIEIDIHSSREMPDEHILLVRDKSIVWRKLGGVARRSPSPLTPRLWAIAAGDLPEGVLLRNSLEVQLDDSVSLWLVFPSREGVLLRQPTGLEVGESCSVAEMYWNEESSSLKLVGLPGGQR